MARTLRDIEDAKRLREHEILERSKAFREEYQKTHTVIETCYGDVVLKCLKDNKPKTAEEIEFLRNLLEEIHYSKEDENGLFCRDDGKELLNKLGYKVSVIWANDYKYLPTVPAHMRSTGEAAKDADKKLFLQLDRNQSVRAASRIAAENSNVL